VSLALPGRRLTKAIVNFPNNRRKWSAAEFASELIRFVMWFYSFFLSFSIRDGVTIAKECIIGAGALILKDMKERQIYRGIASEALDFDSTPVKRI
jgi:hypothetical protein